jgi:hypothetical protein
MTREELLAEVLRWRDTQPPTVKLEKKTAAVKHERSASAGPSSLAPKKKKKKQKVIDLTGDSD